MREIKLIAKMTPLSTFFTIVCYLLIIICIALNLIFSNAATVQDINTNEQTIFYFSIDFLTLIVILCTLYISFFSMNLVDFFLKSEAIEFFFTLSWKYKQLINAQIVLITLINTLLIGLCYIYFFIIDKPLLVMAIFVSVSFSFIFNTSCLLATSSGRFNLANIFGMVTSVIGSLLLLLFYSLIYSDYDLNLNFHQDPTMNIVLYHIPYIFLILSLCLFVFSYPMYYKKIVSSSKC